MYFHISIKLILNHIVGFMSCPLVS